MSSFPQEYKEGLFKGKLRSNKPKLILLFGPPASGKGYLYDKVKAKFDINDINTIDTSVDAFVENDPEYKREMSASCIKKYSDLDCLSKVEENSIMDECTQIYLKYKKIADQYSESSMYDGFNGNFNVVLEVSGNSFNWVTDVVLRKLPANYTIILLYPLVDERELYVRSCNRAKKVGRYVSREFIKNSIKKCEEIILRIKNGDILQKANVYIYDNRSTPKLIYKKVDDQESKYKIKNIYKDAYPENLISKIVGGYEVVSRVYILLVIIIIMLYCSGIIPAIINYAICNFYPCGYAFVDTNL